jgi:hypothetical protein
VVNGRRWGYLYWPSVEATGLNRSSLDRREESVHSSILIIYMSKLKFKSDRSFARKP